MTPQETTDLELMEAIANSDSSALSHLYDRYARILYSFVFKILGSAEESEEVVVDVFSQVWRNAKSYQPQRGRVDTWLFTIARSRALDCLRKRQRQSKILDATTQTYEPDATPQPEEELLIQERRSIVKEALTQLPEEQRIVLELAYFGGYSKSEIAEKISVSIGTVKTRTRLGLNKLRGILC